MSGQSRSNRICIGLHIVDGCRQRVTHRVDLRVLPNSASAPPNRLALRIYISLRYRLTETVLEFAQSFTQTAY